MPKTIPILPESGATLWAIIIVAVIANIGGYASNWYQEFWWFDKILHAYTTFAITLPLAVLLYGAVLIGLRDHRFILVLTIANLGIALGALWEIAEFGVAELGDSDLETRMDTVMDLLADLAGAVFAGILSVHMLERSTSVRRTRGEQAVINRK